MAHFTSILLCLLAFAFLSMGMERSQSIWMHCDSAPKATTLWCMLGYSLLAMALVLGLHTRSVGLALVAFSGHTSLAAGCIFCALVVKDRMNARKTPPKHTPRGPPAQPPQARMGQPK